jgi:hypothetical protein
MPVQFGGAVGITSNLGRSGTSVHPAILILSGGSTLISMTVDLVCDRPPYSGSPSDLNGDAVKVRNLRRDYPAVRDRITAPFRTALLTIDSRYRTTETAQQCDEAFELVSA